MNNVGVHVAKIVEPPILMSRIMTFVLATSLVVLGALVFTLVKMVPLERPEVFFLLNNTSSVNTVIEPLVPDAKNKEAIANYEQGFIREYVIVRNTLYPNAALTKKNWTTITKTWSSDKVYSALTKTDLYNEYAFSDKPPRLDCVVDFSNINNEQAVLKTGSNSKYNEYIVNFTWVCKNIGGQTTQKNYKIRIRIQSVLDEKASNTLENLNKLRDNPLGIRVVEYTILDGDGDPLDSDRHSL